MGQNYKSYGVIVELMKFFITFGAKLQKLGWHSRINENDLRTNTLDSDN